MRACIQLSIYPSGIHASNYSSSVLHPSSIHLSGMHACIHPSSIHASVCPSSIIYPSAIYHPLIKDSCIHPSIQSSCICLSIIYPFTIRPPPIHHPSSVHLPSMYASSHPASMHYRLSIHPDPPTCPFFHYPPYLNTNSKNIKESQLCG